MFAGPVGVCWPYGILLGEIFEPLFGRLLCEMFLNKSTKNMFTAVSFIEESQIYLTQIFSAPVKTTLAYFHVMFFSLED